MEDLISNANKRIRSELVALNTNPRFIKAEGYEKPPQHRFILKSSDSGVADKQIQNDPPMMYDAWTQTDAPFCQKYDPISSSSASPTELKLMEMMETLQEQLLIQTTYIQNLQQNIVASTQRNPTVPMVSTPDAANYRIIANGILEPVEIEEINRELMEQYQEEKMISESTAGKGPINSSNYEVKPTVAVTPSQKEPKILNFRQKLSSTDTKLLTPSVSVPAPAPTPADSINNSSNDSSKCAYNNNDLQNNVQVSIGPNNTKIPAKIFDSIKWESASIATRKLLTTIFDRNTLATHTMTGKPSPAFKHSGKPHKEMLDQNKIKDIIFAVTRKSGATEKEVRNVITTKCADENKMLRTQIKKRQSFIEFDNDNKENLYNNPE